MLFRPNFRSFFARNRTDRLIMLLALGCSFAVAGCTMRKEVWIYTSLPKDVISELLEPLEAAVPDAEVKWYQSSSENLSARLNTEIESGAVKADLVISSDPIWYVEMKKRGELLAYASPAAQEIPAGLRDPDHHFVTVRLPVMVIGYNSAILKPADLPERWKDLNSPRFANKVSMASPLESAATFTMVGMLAKEFGWEYFAGLRKLGVVAEGSQGSVVTRIETGERLLGLLPLEAIIRAGRGKSVVKPIYPLDGAIPVPCPIAILKASEHPQIAQKIYDWFFSAAAQSALVRGGTYSPLPKFPSPEGARPWTDLQNQVMKWSPEILSGLSVSHDRVRAKFSEVVFH